MRSCHRWLSSGERPPFSADWDDGSYAGSSTSCKAPTEYLASTSLTTVACAPRVAETATAPASNASSPARSGSLPGAMNIDPTAT